MSRSSIGMAACFFGLWVLVAQADTVITKDRRNLTGQIVKQDDTGVDLKVKLGVIHIAAANLVSVTREPLPEGFFDPPKPVAQPTSPNARSIDAETKTKVDRLRKEVLLLRKELAEYSRRLQTAPKTVRKVYRTGSSGGSKWQPLDSVAVDEPNPQIPILEEKMQKTRDAISIKNEEITDLMNLTNPAKRDANLSESQGVINRLRGEIKAHRETLAGLQKKLAKTPPKTDWHRVQPGETVGDMFRKRDPEPNPEYLALQKQIKEVQDVIALKNKQVLDITNGGDAGDAVLEAIRKADAQAAARKAEQAEAEKQRLAEFAKLYDTPEKAADFCLKDLMARGIIRTAMRTGVGEIQEQKARWMLTSGQWATASKGVGVAAPGAPLPAGGPRRRPGAKGAQVSYTVTFKTRAGLLREYDGYVLVANIDGFWEPWGYDIDGVSAPPYNGRAAYKRAQKSGERADK